MWWAHTILYYIFLRNLRLLVCNVSKVKKMLTNRLRWIFLTMILGQEKIFVTRRIFYARRIFYTCQRIAQKWLFFTIWALNSNFYEFLRNIQASWVSKSFHRKFRRCVKKCRNFFIFWSILEHFTGIFLQYRV